MDIKLAYSWFYAACVFLGGVVGFIVASSVASLTMGSIFGIALFLSAYLMMQGHHFGQSATLILSLILLIFFSWRFVLTFSFMPAGLMTILSLISLLWHVLQPESKRA